MPDLLGFEEPIGVLLKEIEALSMLPRTPERERSIESLRRRAEQIRGELYANLTPWQRVQVARHPAAFAEDCRRAAILVSPLVSPRNCKAPKQLVDFFAARRAGTHALYIGADGSVRVQTVAQARGMRPWSMPARRSAPAGVDPEARRTAGLQ